MWKQKTGDSLVQNILCIHFSLPAVTQDNEQPAGWKLGIVGALRFPEGQVPWVLCSWNTFEQLCTKAVPSQTREWESQVAALSTSHTHKDIHGYTWVPVWDPDSSLLPCSTVLPLQQSLFSFCWVPCLLKQGSTVHWHAEKPEWNWELPPQQQYNPPIPNTPSTAPTPVLLLRELELIPCCYSGSWNCSHAVSQNAGIAPFPQVQYYVASVYKSLGKHLVDVDFCLPSR